MINKHVELVKRWLAGEAISAQALRENADAADAAAHLATDITRTAADAAQSNWWADEVATTLLSAEWSRADAAEWTDTVEVLMERYKELTGEDDQS